MGCTGLITAAINANCPTPTRSFEAVGWIGMYDEILSKTYDKSTGKLTAITMKSTKQMYPITVRGKMPFKDTKTEAAEKPYGWIFNKTTKFTVLGYSPTSASVVKSLADNKAFMILEQSGQTDSSKYPTFGVEVGLNFSAGTMDTYGDTGGFDVTLMEENAETAGLFLWPVADTEAAADAVIAALIAPGA